MTTLIGTNPDQIPVNSMLGGMAYQDPDNVSVGKITYSGTLLGNGDVVFGGSSTIWTSTGRTSLNVNGTSSSIISLSTASSVNTSAYLYWDNLNFDIQNNTVGGWVRIGTKDYPNALIISSSGNLALGVTPSTWTAGYKAFEFGYNSLSSGDNANIHLTLNGYYNAGWKYKNNGNSNLYSQINGGGHVWYTAPSGTAGAAVTFTQAMSLDSSNLTLSGTGATKLQEGTTAQRPASPQEGMIRKNDTTGKLEGYLRGSWRNISEDDRPIAPANLFDNAGFGIENRPRNFSASGANNSFLITDRWQWVSEQSSASTSLSFGISDTFLSQTFSGSVLTIYNNTGITIPSTAQNYFEQTVMLYPIGVIKDKVTLSFKVSSPTPGTYPICIIHNGYRFLSSFTISAVNVLEKKSITMPVHPISGGSDWVFYRVIFPMGFGSSFKAPATGSWENTTIRAATSGALDMMTVTNNSLNFAEMQLEVGDNATSFIRKDPAMDLFSCMQHYQASVRPMSTFAGVVDGATLASPAATTNFASFGTIQLSPAMFVAPDITVYNPSSGVAGTARNLTAASDVAVQILAQSEKAFSLRVNNVTVTANSEVYVHWSAATGY